jgi:hypothetical protein
MYLIYACLLMYPFDVCYHLDGKDGGGEALTDMVLAIHDSCVARGATPKDYIAFLSMWYGLHVYTSVFDMY